MLSVLHVFEFSQQKLIAQLRCIPFVDIAVDQRRLCSLFKMVLGCFQSPESTFNIVPQFPFCKTKFSFTGAAAAASRTAFKNPGINLHLPTANRFTLASISISGKKKNYASLHKLLQSISQLHKRAGGVT